MKSWSISQPRLLIAPMPECAQEGICSSRQGAAARETPGLIRIALPLDRRLVARALARLAEPFQTAAFLQLRFQFLRQREEKMGVVFRVLNHRGRQGTTR